jgi:UDP:flavonoid glycosyltransferase YjiC (YdhE family)
MDWQGHYARIYGVVKALVEGGADVCVFSAGRFAERTVAAGARHFDLFAGGRSVGAIDTSVPRGCRYIPFATAYAEAVAAEVARTRPSVIVADSHAVIALAVANALDVPFVCIRPGHDVNPATYDGAVHSDGNLQVSETCLEAVEQLRDRYRIAEASPFLYVTMRSPFLNICCEPEQFVSEETRRAVEPVVFFGSLRPREELGPPPEPRRSDAHVYVSFGTAYSYSFEQTVLATLDAIATAVSARSGARATISLGAARLKSDPAASFTRPGIVVESWVDQWSILRDVDVFVTHHGLNSTHESIFHLVPMVGFPLSKDQPGMAALAERLGLSIPLGSGLGVPVEPMQVGAALDAVAASRAEMQAALARAREWELDAIDGRPEIVERIVALS